jgi:hypothetical protein
MRQITFLAIVVAALLVGAAPPASAHHSYAAFDTSVQKTITGTVRKFDWTNPHTWVWVDVTNEQGGTDTWGVEGMSPNYLARRGWTRATLKPGDPISITIRPAKDGSKGGSWMSAKRPNGETLMMGGPITNP